ncbi:MAG: FAD/NAD(P)-binding oxidoreductase, partial [Rhodospirillaceae bacterium]|nr:FAD/NAD(P)-binding oxidoreductase [Rhodospirillaceae bacterium]
PAANARAAMRYLPGLLRQRELLGQGRALLKELRQSGVQHIKKASGLAAIGDDQVRALTFKHKGMAREIPCAHLFLHTGVTPNIQITKALGLPHEWDHGQRCWRPRPSPDLPHIHLVGDGAGIVGARAAALQGRIAAMKLGDDQAALGEAEAELRQCLAARAYVDTLFAPGEEFLDPGDETIVCRCEEVTAGGIRAFAHEGCRDVNQLKAYGRPGMGPCQGRMCGLVVAEVLSRSLGTTMEDVGYFRLRWPSQPVSMDQLANFAEGEDAGL